jgi:ABC-type transporter lipoprotein component MlaA
MTTSRPSRMARVLAALVGSVAKRVGTSVNDRSMNLELFEEVEESVLDLYSGTRNLYLQRRERAIRE